MSTLDADQQGRLPPYTRGDYMRYQRALNYLYPAGIAVDGVWGDTSREWMRALLVLVGRGGDGALDHAGTRLVNHALMLKHHYGEQWASLLTQQAALGVVF